MARPDVSQQAEDVYGALVPMQDWSGSVTTAPADLSIPSDEAQGWALLSLVAALTLDLTDLDALVRDDDEGRPGWSMLLDLDRAPPDYLGYLAMFVGVRLLVGLDDAAQRQRIKETSGQNRGTPDAVIEAARQFLTGTKAVSLDERWGGDAYTFRVRTFLTETPDPVRVEAALMAEKPAGLVLVYDPVTGMTYAELDAEYGTYGDMKATGLTYGQLKELVP